MKTLIKDTKFFTSGIVFFLFLTHASFGQSDVKGYVLDDFGNPLPAATVQILGSSIGAISNALGEFTIQMSEGDTLQVSFVGYISKRITYNGQKNLHITLITNTQELSTAVVIGYGSQKRINLTGSVAEVGAKKLESRGVTNVSSALSGLLPGLTVTQRGGSPGKDGGDIKIRGIGTFGNSNPLILVDGIETGSLAELDVNEVKSISVLKDAAAASIYGVRAANGVILVTTKRGQEGPLKIDYNMQFGVSSPTRLPQKVNAYDLASLYNEALRNEGSPSRFSRTDLQKFQDGTSYTHANIDHVNEVFSEPASRNLYSLSMSGGSSDTQYNIGLGFSTDNGLIANTKYDRTNIRINLDHQVSDRLSIGLSLANTYRNITEPSLGVSWVVHTAYREWATDVLQFSDGRWAYPTHGENQGHNSLAYARDLGTNRINNNRLTTAGFVEYTIVQDLKFKAIVSSLLDNNQTYLWNRGVDLYNINSLTGDISSIPNPSHFGATSSVGRNFFKNNDFNFDLLLNYSKKINDHSIKGLLGYNQRQIEKLWNGMSRTHLIHNSLDQINAADPSNDQTYGYANDYRSRSVFSRLGYNYNEKYLLEFNLRYDGSSRFPKSRDLRFEFFPSVSGAWRISEEDFFENENVSNLKLRASWGQLGNQEIGDYSYLSSIVSGANYVFDNQIVSGVAERFQAPNTIVRWETTTLTNVGFNAGFLKQKLNVTTDFFIKQTDDILGQVPLLGVFGAGEPITNQLSLRNQGFEIQVDYQDSFHNLDFNISVNYSLVKNSITDMAGTDSPGRRVGDPIANIFGYESLGLFHNQAEIDESPSQVALGGKAKPGDIRYADLNNDGVINPDDRTNLGSFFPGSEYGMRIALSYYSFDLSMVWQGVADVNALIGGRYQQPFVLGASPWNVHLDRAIVKNGELTNPDAKYPRTSFGNPNNFVPSSWWVKSTAFLKLRSIQLGFNMKPEMIQKLNISHLRIFISGENLITITSFEGFDPETPTVGDPLGLGSSNAYPPIRTVLMGIKVTF